MNETTEELIIEAPNSNRVFEVDAEKRTIFGLAVPFNEPTHSDGTKFQFTKGVLQLPANPSHVKLLVSHDRSKAVGKATELEEREDGLWARFSVARGTAGDEALSMAEDGVWDGLSIGLRDGAKFSKKGTVTHFSRAVLSEISLTPDPAFSSARVAAVVAEASNRKEPEMAEKNTEAVAPEAPAFDMAELVKALRESMPEPVSPAAPVGFEINESPYAFENGLFQNGGEHDFSADLGAAMTGHDKAAYDRALEFVQKEFAVAQTNVQSALPAGANKVGYVDRREFRYPLYTALGKGSLANGSPFPFPKFNSLTGLVADHVEGVEPTPGAFTTVSQTVTPKAMSGKVEITREVFDQGGSPQVSNLIFDKMKRGYFEAIEGAIVTELTAQAASITDIALTTAGVNAALVGELQAAFADLQYVRGGFSFDTFAVQVDLYKRLVAAVDTTGRPLLPIHNPTNVNGSARRFLSSVEIAGVEATPVWALAASSANVANSWLIDSSSVHAWASTPQRLDFQYRVALVDLAIWGYRAVAVSDLAGVRQVTYDPTV